MVHSIVNRRVIEQRVRAIGREIDASADVLERLHLIQERITLRAVLDLLQERRLRTVVAR